MFRYISENGLDSSASFQPIWHAKLTSCYIFDSTTVCNKKRNHTPFYRLKIYKTNISLTLKLITSLVFELVNRSFIVL